MWVLGAPHVCSALRGGRTLEESDLLREGDRPGGQHQGARRRPPPAPAGAPAGLLSPQGQEPPQPGQGGRALREPGPQTREAVVVGSWCAIVRAQVARSPCLLAGDTCR